MSSVSSTSPRVQLVPHGRNPSFDVGLSDADKELLSNTNFDSLDMASKDFEFDDIFTYHNPQKKLSKVVEVSTPTRERDWSSFSYSHYTAAAAARQKVNQTRPDIGAMYVKNQSDARRHS